MKKFTVCLFGFLFSCGAIAHPIKDNALFKAAVGKWTGKGELVDGDGNKTEVAETWEGKFTDDGNFVISGTRKLGLSEHEFSWEFFANDDLIEGQMKMSDPELDRRFEVTLNEEERTITIKVPLGTDGSFLKVVNTLAEDGKTMSGKVAIQNEAGEETTTGSVEHEREK